MQPITYSMILNILLLAVSGFLSIVFNQPLVFVIAVIMMSHALERFRDDADDGQDDNEQEPAIGFTANVGK